MLAPTPPVMLTCEGFAVREDLASHAERKAAKLLRHVDANVRRVCVHVRQDPTLDGGAKFIARATAEKNSIIHIAHATGRDPQIAVGTALGKLERQIIGEELRTGEGQQLPLRSLEPVTDFLKI